MLEKHQISEIYEFKKLKNPPKQLDFRGNLDLLKSRKISIVGSRKMSFYTKTLILRLCSELKKREICVVSGAALGCDITAHLGGMPLTIAVFGNGLDTIYPPSNATIIKQIYQNALAISEYEPAQRATKWSFLERNRLVVALGEALVVAQADLKSGSLQSARLAHEIGVPVYVLPQRMGESDGTNALLASNKARLIDDIEVFASGFGEICTQNSQLKRDEMLDFIAQNGDFEAVFARFGDMVYEYELEGKIEILGTKILIK